MADKEKKKKKQETFSLPKAWASAKHKNETAQARTDIEGVSSAITTLLIILVIAFVLLGGVSQTGVLKVIMNWSQNVGHTVSNWIEGTSIVTNEDGIYIDPTGQSGTTLAPDEDERIDIVNPADLIDEYKDDFSSDESKEGE